MRLREWILNCERRLRERDIDSSAIESQLLAAHTLGVERTWLFAHPDSEFPDLLGNELLERRLGGEPLAYILGWREFYGRRFGGGPLGAHSQT